MTDFTTNTYMTDFTTNTTVFLPLQLFSYLKQLIRFPLRICENMRKLVTPKTRST